MTRRLRRRGQFYFRRTRFKSVCTMFSNEVSHMRVAIGGVIFLLTVSVTAAEMDLFHIKRNLNRNEFHYKGLIDQCAWQAGLTTGEWHMVEEGRDVREPILLFEKPAYGHTSKKDPAGHVEVRTNAKADLPIHVDLREDDGECLVDVTTRINGEDADLRFVYVCAKEKKKILGLIPRRPLIHYIDVHGFNNQGEPVVERFPQTEWGGAQVGPKALAPDESPSMGTPHCGHGNN